MTQMPHVPRLCSVWLSKPNRESRLQLASGRYTGLLPPRCDHLLLGLRERSQKWGEAKPGGHPAQPLRPFSLQCAGLETVASLFREQVRSASPSPPVSCPRHLTSNPRRSPHLELESSALTSLKGLDDFFDGSSKIAVSVPRLASQTCQAGYQRRTASTNQCLSQCLQNLILLLTFGEVMSARNGGAIHPYRLLKCVQKVRDIRLLANPRGH